MKFYSWTTLLTVLNIAFFLLTWSFPGTIPSISLENLALFQQAIDQGQYYRFLTYQFLHAGLLHLAANSFALSQLGPLTEIFLGPRRMIFIYFLSGIGGGALALFFLGGSPLVGASGAIFGLFGAITFLVVGWPRHLGLPLPPTSAIVQNLLINLAISFIPGVSMAGHVGGLVTGFVVTALLLRRSRARVSDR